MKRTAAFGGVHALTLAFGRLNGQVILMMARFQRYSNHFCRAGRQSFGDGCCPVTQCPQ
jgi:hypothetical protein